MLSKAYKALKKPTAFYVLGIFWTKRQFIKQGRQGKKQWNIANNGEIIFTYDEAEEKYKIPRTTFRNTLDELIEKGFIDIAATGQGQHKVTTLYSISNRWRLYGTEKFEPAERPKSPKNMGFRKGNKYGRNSNK